MSMLDKGSIMSKVKEQMMQEKEDNFAQDLSYAEWLRDNYRQPTTFEINAMEKNCYLDPKYEHGYRKSVEFTRRASMSYKEWLTQSYQSNTITSNAAFEVTSENIYLYLHSSNNPEYTKLNNKGN